MACYRCCGLLLVFLVIFCESTSPLVEWGQPIKYHTYDEIVQSLHDLQQRYPHIVGLYSAQEAFSLPFVGSCGSTQEPCTQWIVELVNRTGKTPQQLSQFPEMIISGELHGDEPLGTLSSVYFIKTLVEQSFKDPWLSMLLNTRIVTVLPMTNAVGYSRGERTELGIDPNRDFPFDQEPQSCLRTVAANTLYSLFQRHLFQILLTFHGGTNVLAYEWGDETHCESTVCEKCPDNDAMHSIAILLQQVAGSVGSFEEAYKVGDMGSTVYPVHGGLEDWAYGASWSRPAASSYCWSSLSNNNTDNNTSIITTNNSNVTNRCIAYLIETSNDKHPPESTLGILEDWTNSSSVAVAPHNGHVPRNIRLSLMAMDLLQPFIYLLSWGGEENWWKNTRRMNMESTSDYHKNVLWERWQWLMRRMDNTPLVINYSSVQEDNTWMTWWVGGGLAVQETWIQFATAASCTEQNRFDCVHGQTTIQNSSGRPWLNPFDNYLSGYLFRDRVNWTSILGLGHVIYVRGIVRMDHNNNNNNTATSMNSRPQSHWVQARTNESWFASIPGHRMEGKRYFTSDYYQIRWKDEKNQHLLEISRVDKDRLQWETISQDYPTVEKANESSSFIHNPETSSHPKWWWWSWLKWVLLGVVLGPGTFPLLGCIGVGCLRCCGIRARMPRVPHIWVHWWNKIKTRWTSSSSYYYPMQSSEQGNEDEEENVSLSTNVMMSK